MKQFDSSQPAIIHLMDIATGADRLTITLPCGFGSCGTFAVAADGTAIAVAIVESAPYHIVVYNAADGSLVRELTTPPSRIPTEFLAVSSGGALVATSVSVQGDGIIEKDGQKSVTGLIVWQGDRLAFERPCDAWGSVPSGLALSPDGGRMITNELDGLKLTALPSGEILAKKNFKEDAF
jgi:hypothetical protein